MDLLTGKQYLQCDIACKHDKTFSKAIWKERLTYFHQLRSTYNFNKNNIYKGASNPIGLRAAIEAYKLTEQNIPSGYMISQDATSSGLQLLSLLVSCKPSWSLCGGNHEKCVDSYTVLYKAMDLGDRLSRKEVKYAIMTAIYGSESVPEKTFQDKVNIFYDVLEKRIPGAWKLNMGLQELWRRIKGSSYSWIMPDNFHCHIETESQVNVPFTFMGKDYSVKQTQKIRPDFHKGLGPNLIHSVDSFIVREMTRRCMYDKEKIIKIIECLDSDKTNGSNKKMVETLWSFYKETNILSARILDYLDKDTMGLVNPVIIARLIKELPEQSFPIITIHDNFKSHPNYGNDVRIQYNLLLNKINKSSLLRFMVRQVTKNPKLNVNKIGIINDANIEQANYALA